MAPSKLLGKGMYKCNSQTPRAMQLNAKNYTLSIPDVRD